MRSIVDLVLVPSVRFRSFLGQHALLPPSGIFKTLPEAKGDGPKVDALEPDDNGNIRLQRSKNNLSENSKTFG